MARPTNEERDAKAAEAEKVNQPAGAQVVSENPAVAPDQALLSRQYQENSPAINTNELAGGLYAPVNVVEQAAAAEKAAEEDKEEKQETVSKEEWERRTKLDVSDPNYINPSLGHYKVK